MKRLKDSEKDMIYYTVLTYGQFVALFNFLNAYGICYRLNYWGSEYAKVQLPDIEKKGQKGSLDPDDKLFLTLCQLRVHVLIVQNYLLKNHHVSVHNPKTFHNTAKRLVAIAPNVALIFVSGLYGGHCSDKGIVENCGILQLLEEGDSVMADHSFKIQELLASRKIYLNIPPFMRRKHQLNPDEDDETREIASVCIHVERAIERDKNCNIFKEILPNSA